MNASRDGDDGADHRRTGEAAGVSVDSLEMRAPDPEERWPDLTVNDGRRTLGFVYDNDDGTATATDALGGRLGNFPKRDGARLAIIEQAGARHG